MAVALDEREITVTGARNIWREHIGDEYDLQNVIKVITSELCIHNQVHLVVIVGPAQISISERG